MAAIGPAYYPEMTERVFILQAPWVVAKIWAVLAPLLPTATQSKVAIVEAVGLSTPPHAIFHHSLRGVGD